MYKSIDSKVYEENVYIIDIAYTDTLYTLVNVFDQLIEHVTLTTNV